MIWTESRLLAEQLERDALLAEIGDMGIYVVTRALDGAVWRLRAIWTASLAGAKPGFLCRRR
jgi:hypothetical protein